jgi:hypothetical protein
MDELKVREFTETVFDEFVKKFDTLRNDVVSDLNDKLDKFVNEKMSYDAETWEYPEILKSSIFSFDKLKTPRMVKYPEETAYNMFPLLKTFDQNDIVLVICQYSQTGDALRGFNAYCLNIYGEWIDQKGLKINVVKNKYKIPKFIVEFYRDLLLKIITNLPHKRFDNSYVLENHSQESHINKEYNDIMSYLTTSNFIDQFLQYNIDVPRNQKYLDLTLENKRLLSENNDLIKRSNLMEAEMSKFEDWRESMDELNDKEKSLDEKEETLKKRIAIFNIKKKQMEDKEKELNEKEAFYNKISELS